MRRRREDKEVQRSNNDIEVEDLRWNGVLVGCYAIQHSRDGPREASY